MGEQYNGSSAWERGVVSGDSVALDASGYEMTVFGRGQADCFVYVYREGALSAVGHDLKLRVTGFTIEVGEEPSVHAELHADSLRVVGVLREGTVDEREPSSRDRKEIEGNIARDVLEAGKYPEITFRSKSVERTGQSARIVGSLDLHGVRRDIAFEARQEGDRWAARVPIHQPDFRIKPYRALLGALRVKPEIVVEVSVPSS